MQDKNKKNTPVMGIITEALPNTFFKVKLEGKEEEMLTYLAGKIRLPTIPLFI